MMMTKMMVKVTMVVVVMIDEDDDVGEMTVVVKGQNERILTSAKF